MITPRRIQITPMKATPMPTLHQILIPRMITLLMWMLTRTRRITQWLMLTIVTLIPMRNPPPLTPIPMLTMTTLSTLSPRIQRTSTLTTTQPTLRPTTKTSITRTLNMTLTATKQSMMSTKITMWNSQMMTMLMIHPPQTHHMTMTTMKTHILKTTTWINRR